MTVRAAKSLMEEALQDWAARRIASDSPQIRGWDWRGSKPWNSRQDLTPEEVYRRILEEWEHKGWGRPPAFQDGRARPEQLLPGTPGALGAVWANTIPRGESPTVGRPVQLGELDWTFWLLRCGRGYGKTETGGRTVIEWAQAGVSPILIAGATSLDVRASMVEGPGESAIQKICSPDFMPNYEPSKRKLTFPNGVECQLLSAEEPERFRGVQFVKAWCVAEGTLIETEYGSIPIEQVRVGDRVWTRKGLRRVHRAGLTKKAAEVWEIVTERGSVRLTADHRVWYEGRWTTCAEVRERGTMASLTTADPSIAESPVGTLTGVVAVRKLETPSDVYDLSVEGEPEFFANGLLVHNCDELAAWTLLDECWRQIRYVMRVKRPGVRVQIVITTTPRAKPLITQLSRDPRCVLTVRPSYDNMANLADEYRNLIAQDEGTRFGRQEIHGEVLEDVEGALWTEAALERTRISPQDLEAMLQEKASESAAQLAALNRIPLAAALERVQPDLDRQVMGVDPPGGRTDCGIVVCAFWKGCPWGRPRCPGHLFVRHDATETERPSPERWARTVVVVYWGWNCDRVYAETNYGGEMVKSTILTEDPNVPVEMVQATRGKRVRAEPVANLWTGEHPRGHIVGHLPALEQELTTFVPDSGQPSPNRMDAMVWAAIRLMLGKKTVSFGPSDLSRQSNWRTGV